MPKDDELRDTMLRELEKTRQRLQTLFEFNPNGVFSIDRSGRFTALNPACERIMGYAPEEIVGRSFTEVTAPESLEAAQEAFHKALSGEANLRRVIGFARDGSRRHLDMSVAPISGENGVDGVLVMAHDVTQRLQAEAERDAVENVLRANEDRYQVFISQSTEAIWRYELNKLIPLSLSIDEQIDMAYEHAWLAECNDAMARIYGFEHASQVIGKKLIELVPRIPENEAYLRTFVANNWRIDNIETSRLEGDGRVHHHIANFLGIIEDGCVVRAWGTRRDITERKEAENALRESQEQLDLALRSGDLGTWNWNLETGAMSCSPLTRVMLGLDIEDESDIHIDTRETYQKFQSVVHPDDRTQVEGECKRTSDTHAPLEIEYRVVWPDGSVHWLSVVGRLVHPNKNQPARIIGTCRDITPRKRRELHQSIIAEASEMLASSLDLEETLSNMVQLLVPAHADWCVMDLLEEEFDDGDAQEQGSVLKNEGDKANLGRRVAVAHRDPYKEEFLWHMKSLDRCHDPLSPNAQCESAGHHTQAPLLLPEITPEQMQTLWPDTTQRALMSAAGVRSLMCVPLQARDRTLGFLTMVSSQPEQRYDYDDLALAQDLARRTGLAVDNARLYGQAKQARREAEAANRAKDEFLAVVSHELRTPLTPLLGWIDLINADRLDEAQNIRAHEAIGRNAHAQLQLVNDLLDVSRIISGKLPINPQTLDWRDAVEAAIESMVDAAADKKISLEWQMPERSILVSGDVTRLRQVATNLIANAIKFTPAGGHIEVSLSTVDSDRTQHGTAVLEVRDSGIGIVPEFLPHVWERFRQADATTTRRFGGLGLGLSIVRHIVLAHGGEVAVDSAGVNQGATFRVLLPCIESSKPEVESDIDNDVGISAPDDVSILLVDDEEDARELFMTMLRDADWDVRTATSSDEAFALLNSNGWRPSIIVSDVALSDVDGYEFLQRLRASQWSDIPVIALTAYARDEDRRRALEAGFAQHLSKPAITSDLQDAICALLHKPHHNS